VAITGSLTVAEEVKQCGVEKRGILQKSEVAGIGQDQQTRAWNGGRDIFGMRVVEAAASCSGLRW
jgi:hypothetical protein